MVSIVSGATFYRGIGEIMAVQSISLLRLALSAMSDMKSIREAMTAELRLKPAGPSSGSAMRLSMPLRTPRNSG